MENRSDRFNLEKIQGLPGDESIEDGGGVAAQGQPLQ